MQIDPDDIVDEAYELNNQAGKKVNIVILGDLDYDKDVDLNDLAQLLSHYGMAKKATYEDGDIDGDGDVDTTDLNILLENYGAGA